VAPRRQHIRLLSSQCELKSPEEISIIRVVSLISYTDHETLPEASHHPVRREIAWSLDRHYHILRRTCELRHFPSTRILMAVLNIFPHVQTAEVRCQEASRTVSDLVADSHTVARYRRRRVEPWMRFAHRSDGNFDSRRVHEIPESVYQPCGRLLLYRAWSGYTLGQTYPGTNAGAPLMPQRRLRYAPGPPSRNPPVRTLHAQGMNEAAWEDGCTVDHMRLPTSSRVFTALVYRCQPCREPHRGCSGLPSSTRTLHIKLMYCPGHGCTAWRP
jgi:hypothetical protein